MKKLGIMQKQRTTKSWQTSDNTAYTLQLHFCIRIFIELARLCLNGIMEFLEIDLDRKYSSITFDAPDFSVAKSGVGDGWGGWGFIFPYPVYLLAHRQV